MSSSSLRKNGFIPVSGFQVFIDKIKRQEKVPPCRGLSSEAAVAADMQSESEAVIR